MEWPSFRDKYSALIHGSDHFSNIEKMHYLKSAVYGEASKLIQNFSTTEANYVSAWETLMERYENTRILASTFIHSLFSLSPMAFESSSELRRVLDTFNQYVGSLQNLNRPVNHWDDWLVYFLSSKLDSSLRKDWENSLSAPRDMPSYSNLRSFLSTRLQALNAVKETQSFRTRSSTQQTTTNRMTKNVSRVHHASQFDCHLCQKDHFLFACAKFKAKPLEERLKIVQTKRLCFNCLKPKHTQNLCPSTSRCKTCNEKHHTLIHKPAEPTQVNSLEPSASVSALDSTLTHVTNHQMRLPKKLLATAIIRVESPNGASLLARALVDPGSESCYITSKLAKQLQLPTHKTQTQVLGVGGCLAGTSNAIAFHSINSLPNPEFRIYIQSFILPTLTHLIPSSPVPVQDWPHFAGLSLADPDFAKPAIVDVILGVGAYASVLQEGLITGPEGAPIAQATSLGWILFETISSNSV